MWKSPEESKYIIAMGIAFFGAAVHATNQLRLARKNDEKFTVTDWAILFPTALFAGLFFGLLAQLVTDDPIYLMTSVATGSFLGIAGLNAGANVFLDILVKSRGK